jgi:hypothetical protein
LVETTIPLRVKKILLKNTSSDGDISSEGTLLVDVVRLDGIGGSLESQSNLLEVSGVTHNSGGFGLFTLGSLRLVFRGLNSIE